MGPVGVARSLLLPFALATGGAQLPGAPGPSAAPQPAPSRAAAGGEATLGSPRAMLAEFLEACRAGRYVEAARALELSPERRVDGPGLARRLKAVLDRYAWIDLERVSGLPEGDTADGLRPGVEAVAELPLPSGRRESVRLVRAADGADPQWMFSAATVARIDAWHATLPDRWFRERLPDALLRPGPRELLWWQWLALPLLLTVGVALGRPLAGASAALLTRLFARTRTEWDDTLLLRLRGPLTLGFSLAVVGLCVPSLALYAPAQAFVGRLLRTASLLALFWALLRVVDVASAALRVSAWGQASPSARSVVLLGARFVKVGVLGVGGLTALTALGYPVVGLLAGLGVGGLALALAAQKTVENLFGSVSLAVDRPFAVGDFVKVDDFVATVEAIGLRSTRFRTLDRTLITIPNGRLADMRLESFTARDRLRLACTLGLVYGTTAEQMRQVLAGLEQVLRAHPRIWPDAVVVRFKEYAASSLDIEVMAWFETDQWPEFQLIRQEILLAFMQVVERAGTSFAFPTRTVHVVAGAAPADAVSR